MERQNLNLLGYSEVKAMGQHVPQASSQKSSRRCAPSAGLNEPWRYAAPSNLLGNREERAKCLKNAPSMFPWPRGNCLRDRGIEQKSVHDLVLVGGPT